MYPLAGIADHLTPTGIRRGFARDLSRVANVPRPNIELVRRALSHSQKKVTELYIGDDDISYNKLIADNNQGPTHKDALIGTHTATLLDLRTTPEEVANYCNTNGLDLNDSSHRAKARQALRTGRLARYRVAKKSRHQIARQDETSTIQYCSLSPACNCAKRCIELGEKYTTLREGTKVIMTISTILTSARL